MKNRFVLAIVGGLVCCFCSIHFAADAVKLQLAMSGRSMTAEQVAAAEKQVEQNPSDVDSRTQLLGYYFGKQHQDPAVRKAK